MKVCILSMQKVPNFGSLLQSYSLKKMLEALGCEVRFIDIQPNPKDDLLASGNSHEFRNEHEPKGLLQKLRKLDRYTVNRFRNKKTSRKQEFLFEKFREDILNIRDTDNDEQYDLCVIGSDEVFNCKTSSAWGFTTQLFGNVRQSEHVITYAASCGATTYAQLNQGMRNAIWESFKRISGFSARDNNTGRFISAMTDQRVEYHSDPVWVADFDDELAEIQISVKLPARYCVVYSYYNRIHQKKDIEAIQRFCKRHKLELIALGAPQMWIRNYVAVSPFEALKIIQDADFIITDTFHGTIFSEKYNGNYAVVLRESNTNKLMDLIERNGLKRHLIQNFSELNTVYQPGLKVDTSLIMQEKERIRSLEYLRKYTCIKS